MHIFFLQRSLDEERKFNRVKTPRTDSWSISEDAVNKNSPRAPSSRHKSRPNSPVREPLSPRVRTLLRESLRTQMLTPQSPRSPRNNYKPEALDEDWTPSSLHGGFSKNDSWVYVSLTDHSCSPFIAPSHKVYFHSVRTLVRNTFCQAM